MTSKSRKSIITGCIPSMFKGVRPGWKKILLGPRFKPILNKCLRDLDVYLQSHGVTLAHIEKNGLRTYIRPSEHNIFEAMKYFDPQNLQVIIMGQDPYTKPEEAHGLSFSVPKTTRIPSSLAKVYDALVKQEILLETPEHGNLVNWARQGVLLLNRFLTRSPNIVCEKNSVHIEGNGDSKKVFLHEFWGELTAELLNYLTGDFMRYELNHQKHRLFVMLWGGPARASSMFINRENLPPGREVIVLEWGHPSGMNQYNQTDNPQNFIYCDHFAKIPHITWNPEVLCEANLCDQFHLLRKEKIDRDIWEYIQTVDPAILYDDASNSAETALIKEIVARRNAELENIKLPEPTPESVLEPVLEPVLVSEIRERKECIVAAVDGGCLNNGAVDARASYGAYFPATFGEVRNPEILTNIELYGLVPPNILVYDIKEMKLCINAEKTTKRTNGRGELLGAINALHHIIKTIHVLGPRPVILIADAEYTINLMKARIWTYMAQDTSLKNVNANRDLVMIVGKLLIALAKIVPNASDPNFRGKRSREILFAPEGTDYTTWGGLTVLHIHSHLGESGYPPVPDEDTLDFEKHICNKRADILCNRALQDLDDSDTTPVLVKERSTAG